MWTIFLKPSLNALQYCFCFMLWIFSQEMSGNYVVSTNVTDAHLVT